LNGHCPRFGGSATRFFLRMHGIMAQFWDVISEVSAN
jgi:hypothetical protein